MLTPRRWLTTLGLYALPPLLAIAICPLFGAVSISLQDMMHILTGTGPWTGDHDILLRQRLPRVFLALAAGGGLALTGSVYQALLRNPLATPYTLGVTGGGAVGAVAVISIPALHGALGPISTVQAASLAGSMLVTAIIYSLARRGQSLSVTTLLLAGVTIGIFCAALVMLIQYVADPYGLAAANRWLMGGLTVTGYQELAFLAPLWIPGVGLLLVQMNVLNHLLFGDELAAGYGVNVSKTQFWAFAAGSITVAGIVAAAGPIGFVGLIVPHAVRLISGNDQRIVLPASLLTGGAFLAVCDTVARTALTPREIPVGIITALVGVPFFLHILLSSRRRPTGG